jgi:hypothetical protein
MQVRSTVHMALVEAALQKGWQLHADQMDITARAADAAAVAADAEKQGEGLPCW